MEIATVEMIIEHVEAPKPAMAELIELTAEHLAEVGGGVAYVLI